MGACLVQARKFDVFRSWPFKKGKDETTGKIPTGNESKTTKVKASSPKQPKGSEAMIYLFEYSAPGLLGLQRDVTPLINELRSFPGWAQCFDRTWLIATPDAIEVVERRLQPYLPQTNDKFLLLPIERYTGRLPQEIWDWINNSRNMEFQGF
jgi:hypothetical protein